MSRITAEERMRAIGSARTAVEADRRGDVATRDRALADLWAAVGYWLQPRQLTTAEYRGERVSPKMIRMPQGPSIRWQSGRWRSAEAWAQEE